MKILLALWKRLSFTVLIAFIFIGFFDIRIGLLAIICMLGSILSPLFKGRFWCGNLCPRGSFFDNICSIISNGRRTPSILKSIYFRAVITVIMLTILLIGIASSSADPYKIGLVFYRLIAVTTLIGILLSILFNPRTWCSFCPMGSIASLIFAAGNKKNQNSLLKVTKSCTHCTVCEKVCPMGITPYKFKGSILTHHDCIQCSRCKASCPRKAIN